MLVQIDSLIEPIETDLQQVMDTKLSALVIAVEYVNKGLPDGESFLNGIDTDKSTLSQITIKYAEAKKAGKLSSEFDKTCKSTLESATKVSVGSHLTSVMSSSVCRKLS